jgi:hypothetical protein
MFKAGLITLVLLGLAQGATSQKPRALGTVSGFVFCADTNTPARLASVVLRPVPAAKSDKPGPHGLIGMEARMVHTSLDGSFTIAQVAPGTYFVLASMDGYVSPLDALGIESSDLLTPTQETRTNLLQHVPTVTVEGNQAASINISLERGAAVEGTILFDDGSPAPGLSVRLLTHKQNKWVPVESASPDGFGHGMSTNDRGAYRISGMPPGKECLIEVELTMLSNRMYISNGGMSSYSEPSPTLRFYSGGAFRPDSGKPFGLKLGEERPGEDIVLPLSKLHKIQGTVSAQRDGHVINQATLSLVYADDKTPVETTRFSGDESGFAFAFVPEGNYTLQVSNAADVVLEDLPNPPGSTPPTHSETRTLRSYGASEVPVQVDGDRLGLNVTVPDVAAKTN